MDPAEIEGYERQGPIDTVPLAKAGAQLEAIARYVSQAREELDRIEALGQPPFLDPGKAWDFFFHAPQLSLTDESGKTVAVVVSPAVLEVLEDALGLAENELHKLHGTDQPVAMTVDEMCARLKGQATS
ncbi:hypothetical protein NX801_30580 [Streptomyces sp. LP05-1]|uniref:Uncharacterized protein n=1 Tax=Streptomyces pyxinae TaxID=2970734 RepID=A0ABT2CS44_9ACTN|nr:hypothetical protein [Streptomyces sp. LP05-1]MCS0639902.1 hypothetical protein [Streptomyces sp. LP05-1]